MKIKLNIYIACIIAFLFSSTECIYPQKLKWNFGLSRKQSSEVIPHSKHSFQTAKPKKKSSRTRRIEPAFRLGVPTIQRLGNDRRI